MPMSLTDREVRLQMASRSEETHCPEIFLLPYLQRCSGHVMQLDTGIVSVPLSHFFMFMLLDLLFDGLGANRGGGAHHDAVP